MSDTKAVRASEALVGHQHLDRNVKSEYESSLDFKPYCQLTISTLTAK